MGWEITCGSKIVVAVEVRTPNWDILGDTPIGAEMEVIDRAVSWAMDMATITVTARVAVSEATVEKTEDRTESTPRTGVH